MKCPDSLNSDEHALVMHHLRCSYRERLQALSDHEALYKVREDVSC